MAFLRNSKQKSKGIRAPRRLAANDNQEPQSFMEASANFFRRYFWGHALEFLLCLLLIGALSIFTYIRVLPERYSYKVGDVATEDITNSREIKDQEATAKRAAKAAENVQPIYKRSDEISRRGVERVQNFYALADQVRTELKTSAVPKTNPTNATTAANVVSPTVTAAPAAPNTVASPTPAAAAAVPDAAVAPPTYTAAQIEEYANLLISRVRATLGYELSLQQASMLVSIEESFYSSIKDHAAKMADTIMAEPVDQERLATEIDANVRALTENLNYYKTEHASIANVLSALLQPNVLLDTTATAQAKEAERKRVLEDPTMIPAGSRLVNAGEVIDTRVYNYLLELNLIQQPGFDYALLFRLIGLFGLLTLTMALYMHSRLDFRKLNFKDLGMIILTILGSYVLSAYLANFSIYAAPVYLIAVILTLHFGFECGFVLSMLSSLALLPLMQQPGALFPILFGLFCVSFAAGELSKLKAYAWLILAAILSPFTFTLIYGSLIKSSWGLIGQSSVIAAMCGGLCAVAALGLQPIFEMLSSSVSASHLIKLAQPSQALLRRLFLEAPGTYQHSMMVANLAEKAAEVIGADSLLVRVGAYYHDIGKMEHPEVFTENQTDYNPHDYLSPEESVSMIIGHVEAGVKTARRHRLPLRLQDFIKEHHGNTLQASFYYKACEAAEASGLPEPAEDSFRYPWPIPGSKETAIVMLADSLEAAIRSTQAKDLAQAEKVARNIVKIKNEQNQLINSGLSYQEVEQLVQSFIQTYQGQFHERVRYPDARPDPKQAKQIPPVSS